ncbi:hypothetical protein BABINDRAFT_104167 [Babjeviella inositovora NRRL Y-12698]|uniref:Uncharacterized protein n=1 Tax=Babjeviella inositovora NRRL Y-12698 TaxID=984486 RepID=A0A1E3QHU9_9ASCO|nr:uncharacterized protein BABINDRAFT_104167 [Babjeviella inositovora NRRL Y-12698]ODQ77266.1 hypothetical protein BABINDRAFT_104167 [Babjeviella inositovora NRRL Y-12698]
MLELPIYLKPSNLSSFVCLSCLMKPPRVCGGLQQHVVASSSMFHIQHLLEISVIHSVFCFITHYPRLVP